MIVILFVPAPAGGPFRLSDAVSLDPDIYLFGRQEAGVFSTSFPPVDSSQTFEFRTAMETVPMLDRRTDSSIALLESSAAELSAAWAPRPWLRVEVARSSRQAQLLLSWQPGDTARLSRDRVAQGGGVEARLGELFHQWFAPDLMLEVKDWERRDWFTAARFRSGGLWEVEGSLRRELAEERVTFSDSALADGRVTGWYCTRVSTGETVVRLRFDGWRLEAGGSLTTSSPERPGGEYWLYDSASAWRAGLRAERGNWSAGIHGGAGVTVTEGMRLPTDSSLKRFHYGRTLNRRLGLSFAWRRDWVADGLRIRFRLPGGWEHYEARMVPPPADWDQGRATFNPAGFEPDWFMSWLGYTGGLYRPNNYLTGLGSVEALRLAPALTLAGTGGRLDFGLPLTLSVVEGSGRLESREEYRFAADHIYIRDLEFHGWFVFLTPTVAAEQRVGRLVLIPALAWSLPLATALHTEVLEDGVKKAGATDGGKAEFPLLKNGWIAKLEVRLSL